MATYRVPLTTAANTTVDVTTETTDPRAIAELAAEQADVGDLCRQCGHAVELGDDWRPVTDQDTGIPFITLIT
ncbi:hypothetical protein AB0N09_28065 [Streptomyces erythrochromogenes]|uniref:hypothetical protein n=1 Tax=Streptomyces erythrochromogenes TaxID=285574 RepID=UPI003444642E